MTKKMIEVKNLSKTYMIGKTDRYLTLRDSIVNVFKKKATMEIFSALKNISFEVERGSVMGIIGKNGAGKSTLLKVISRISPPSEGEIRIKGRVASLLEVGTGFHPELTGKENIFLNGSILGMKKREIDNKYEEIVKFSGVENFLETPVKRYSSGMFVRLAFAVAAHLEPEILLVDEVLAVGDAEFQKKSLGKMKEVTETGRTILFVSHNMHAIESLCDEVMHISGGELKMLSDDIKGVIDHYIKFSGIKFTTPYWENEKIREFINDYFIPIRFFLGDKMGNVIQLPSSNDAEIWLFIEGEVKKFDKSLMIGYSVYTEGDLLIYWSRHNDDHEKNWFELNKGKNTLRSKFPSHFLNEGEYRIELQVSIPNKWIIEPQRQAPSVKISISGGLSQSKYWMSKRPGLLAPIFKWEKLL